MLSTVGVHGAYSGADPKICLLCDHAATAMNWLHFKTLNRGSGLGDEYVDARLSLMSKRFGVCDSCMADHQGQHLRVVLARNLQVVRIEHRPLLRVIEGGASRSIAPDASSSRRN